MNLTSYPSLSSAHYEAHKDFLGGVETFDCSHIRLITDEKERCDFSKHPGCHATDAFFDYVTFVFCVVPQYGNKSSESLAYVALIGLSIGFFVLLIINAYTSFAHNVISIVHFLKLGEHEGGAVIVVIMNGGADLLGRFLRYKVDTELILNEMLGTAMFLTAFGAGIIVIIYPFVIRPSFFLRDQFIFIISFAFFNFSIVYEPVNVIQGFILMLLYLLFVGTIIVHYSLEKSRAEQLGESAHPNGRNMARLSKIGPILLNFNEDLEFGEGSSPNDQIFKQFLRTLNPIKSHEMEASHIFKKILLILVAPLRILFILILPCVNYTLPGHGWSKLMNCINLILTPFTIAGVIKFQNLWYYFCLLAPGLIVAPTVFNSTRTDRPPVFLPLFAVYGALGSVCITYFLVSELLSITDLLASVCGIEQRITYMAIFPLINTIADCILIVTIVAYGYSYMAFTALYYSPMLNVIFNCGMIIFRRFLETKNHSVSFRGGDVGVTGMIFINLILAATIISVCMTEFELRRSIGFFLVIMYLIYMTYIILVAMGQIHEYGTDHMVEAVAKRPDATWA